MERGLTRRSLYLSMVYILGTTALVAGYNACGRVDFQESAEHKLSLLNSGAVVVINENASYTNDQQVHLTIESTSPKVREMYVTNDPQCASGGSWEPYARAKSWQLAQENTEARVFVKFRESEDKELESGCVSDSIVHDNIPPRVWVDRPAPALTNQQTVEIGFRAEDSLSGVQAVLCENNGSSAPCSSPFLTERTQEGQHSVSISAVDAAGNRSQPVLQAWLADFTPPSVTINLAPPALTGQTQARFEFSAVDALNEVVRFECRLDGEAYAECSTPQMRTVGSGSHSFSVRAYDRAGNVSPEAVHLWAVDLQAPTVTIVNHPPAISGSGTGDFTFTAVDDTPGAIQFECQMGGGAFSACGNSYSATGLANGSHTFSVRAIDGLGNISAPANYTWLVDLTGPQVTITQGPSGRTKLQDAQFLFEGADSGSGLAGYECSLDGASFSACSPPQSYSGLAEGAHEFRVRARDQAGNLSAIASRAWTIDLTPPTLQITSGPDRLTSSTTAAFEITAVDADGGLVSSLQCRLDGQATYEACASPKSYTDALEGDHIFYARAVDSAGNVSEPVSYAWSIDRTGPVISFAQLPLSKLGLNDTARIEFLVTDAPAGVASVNCGLLGALQPCQATAVVDYQLAEGSYSFVIQAVDSFGNTSAATVSWEIESDIVSRIQTVQILGSNKVDLLVVFDNSGSMSYEKTSLSQRFSNLLAQLETLDWQIGIITADVDANAPQKDGRLLEIKGHKGQYMLTPAMGLDVAQTAFGATVDRPTSEGSGGEQGIGASYRSIERAFDSSQTGNAPNTAFFRSDAALAILAVSDSNDMASSPKSRPENLLALVHSSWSGNKAFAFHSIIVRPGDTNCRLSSNNDDYGYAYQQLSHLTGGIVGSVCEPDYGAQLSTIGQQVRSLVRTVTLECRPVDLDGNGSPDVIATSSSGVDVGSYTVTGQSVTFDTNLPLGDLQLRYSCLE